MDFNKFAKTYREFLDRSLRKIGFSSRYFADYKAREIYNFTINSKKASANRVLDIGCGDGVSTSYLKKYFPEALIIGLDVSSECIQEAINNNPPDIEFHLFNGRSLDYPRESFDIIVIANVFHHVPKDIQVSLLKECSRVLGRDGRLFIFEHNPNNPVTLYMVKDCVFDKDAVLMRASALKKLLIENNFSVKFRYIVFFPGFLKYFLTLERFLYWVPLGGQYYSCSKKRLNIPSL